MLSEKYLKKRYRQGREETRKEFLDWLRRRDAATAEGIPFDEPPPGGHAPGVRSVNGNGTNTATPQPAANGNGTQPRHFADLESWYIRKGIAEDMGRPFNEPHPFNGTAKRNGNGSV